MIALSPWQGAVLIFVALLVSFVLAIAIGVVVRVRFGEKPKPQKRPVIQDPNLAAYVEHKDRPAPCICPQCRAWRADIRRRMESFGSVQ